MKVWKFEFPVADTVEIKMPKGARILSVGTQRERHICLWALVDTSAPDVARTLYVRGTGHEVVPKIAQHYLGTVMDGQFVWHVFE